MLALKLPGYHVQHIESDERIYLSLVENWIESRTYSLRGTEILDLLPPSMYDKPLFHHPPMLTFLLIPFAWMEASQAAIAVSWIGHFAAVIGIALIAWAWRPAGRRSLDFLLWLPVLAMAVDPVFSFAGRKIWPDTLVGGFGALAIGACALGIRSDRGGWLVAGGAFAAFAGLSKLTGLLAVPIGIIAILLSPGNARQRAARCFVFVAPCAVLMAPWFWIFFREYGQFLPAWIHPDADVLAANPHLKRAFDRPFGFYAYELIMVSPVAGVCLAAACMGLSQGHRMAGRVSLCWTVMGLSVMTCLQSGHGAHLRFLTPVIPGLYVALTGMPPRREHWLAIVATLAMIYGISASGFYLVQGLDFDDIVTVPNLLWRAWRQSAAGG